MKLPQLGKVKTRLAASVGEEEAVAIYRQLVDRVVRNLPGSTNLRVCFDPPNAEDAIRGWLAPSLIGRMNSVDFRPQVNGDLGERLAAGFRDAFADGYAEVAAIGGDCITMSPDHFKEAWKLLDGGKDAVYGPAEDGGYYLLAIKAEQPELFSGIAWGEEDVLAESLANAKLAGLQVGLLEELGDVDELHDWEQAREVLAQ